MRIFTFQRFLTKEPLSGVGLSHPPSLAMSVVASALLAVTITILSVSFYRPANYSRYSVSMRGTPVAFIACPAVGEFHVLWGNLLLSLGIDSLLVFLVLRLNARWHLRSWLWGVCGAAGYLTSWWFQYALDTGLVVRVATAMFAHQPATYPYFYNRLGKWAHLVSVSYFLLICLSAVGLFASLDSLWANRQEGCPDQDLDPQG